MTRDFRNGYLQAIEHARFIASSIAVVSPVIPFPGVAGSPQAPQRAAFDFKNELMSGLAQLDKRAASIDPEDDDEDELA
jgi:hypothetical protein